MMVTELGENNENAGLNGEIRSGMPEGVGKWFEEMEVALKGVKPSEISDGLHSALEDDGSPKSSLKAITKAIEVELFCLADSGVSDGVGDDTKSAIGRSISRVPKRRNLEWSLRGLLALPKFCSDVLTFLHGILGEFFH